MMSSTYCLTNICMFLKILSLTVTISNCVCPSASPVSSVLLLFWQKGWRWMQLSWSRGAEVSPSGDHREGSCRGRVLPLRRGWTGPLRIIQVTSGHAWWLKTCGGANMGQQWGNWEVGSLRYWVGFFCGLKRHINTAVWLPIHVSIAVSSHK